MSQIGWKVINIFFSQLQMPKQAPGEGRAQEGQNGQLVPFLGDVGSREADNRPLSREEFKDVCSSQLAKAIPEQQYCVAMVQHFSRRAGGRNHPFTPKQRRAFFGDMFL